MHRFPLGRGRWMAAISSIVILVGCVLPWFTAGDKIGGLPPTTGNAFEGTGILVFLAALATLALVSLPYAAGDRPVGFDRWPPYLVILAIGVIGLLIRSIDLWGRGVLGPPDRSPGLWLVGLGLIGLARATFEIAQSVERR
ncbi:MAG TPA: hypothetical protein VNF73_06995 [Candidatus Saccharimonadales bacterium]|nr:hypothetical protein [Candidatus Saccharimonadales bacterium]